MSECFEFLKLLGLRDCGGDIMRIEWLRRIHCEGRSLVMLGFGRMMGFEMSLKDRSGKTRIEVVRSNNNIAILCTMKYKTRDEGHENSARLS